MFPLPLALMLNNYKSKLDLYIYARFEALVSLVCYRVA